MATGTKGNGLERETGLKTLGLIVALLCGPAFTGCATNDPLRTREHRPASSSSLYVSSIPGSASARSRATPEQDIADRTFTLAECIKIALERNPRTRSSWHSSRSTAAKVGQAKSAYLPSADFTTGARRGDLVSLDTNQETGPANAFDAGFGVRYLLFDGGDRSARVKGAEAELLAANFRHNTILQDVALAVEEAYYELLAAMWLKKVAEETVEQTKHHVDLAHARYKSGVAARSDVLKTETEKADADLASVRARSSVRIARGRLAIATGLRVSKSFEIVDLPENIHGQELADIEQLLDEAAATRPELRAALARIEARTADISIARARYWPTVTADADYGWRDRTFVPDRDEWSMGVSIDLPLFAGFNRTYQVRESKSELARTIADYENLLRGVELEIWTAYSEVTEAREAIEAAKKLVSSAEESARVAEGEYKNGTGFIIELIDAQTARTEARNRLVQANLDWYAAMARFERAAGRTLAD